MVTVRSKQELKKGIISGTDEIKVADPKLARWIVIVHAIKQTAWAVAIVFIAGAIAVAISTGGTGAPAAAVATGPAYLAVGSSGIVAMVGLGVALGGVSGLILLRKKYRIKEKGNGYVVLRKKNI